MEDTIEPKKNRLVVIDSFDDFTLKWSEMNETKTKPTVRRFAFIVKSKEYHSIFSLAGG